jgi:hypothetical protein
LAGWDKPRHEAVLIGHWMMSCVCVLTFRRYARHKPGRDESKDVDARAKRGHAETKLFEN